ncbi:DUF2783 domain-containing protein [Roseateles sp.]|jgi:hypothetical protein|uniref:DUF2783 domain-containing protein n=1 Tax=Roseateles sp. TaxID=1971397 RepID=UPI0037C9E418
MADLQRLPNLEDTDGFYEALIDAQRGLSEEQADMLLAKLALILSNHIGVQEVLVAALNLARENTLARTAAA